MTVLSFIGTGKYDRLVYRWDNEGKQFETHVFTEAMAEWFPNARLIVLLTEKARKSDYWQYIVHHVPHAEPVDIPSGRTEDEMWELFGSIVDAIPACEEVVFDITHGFRSLPVLSLLAITYLQAAGRVRLKHVLYGAFDRDADPDQAPVFDLTPFIELLNWANAAQILVQTGDSREIAKQLKVSYRSPIGPLGKYLSELGQALHLVRPAQISYHASKLSKQLREFDETAVTNRHRPLNVLLNGLRDGFNPLAIINTTDPGADLLRAELNMVRWYAYRNQPLPAATLAREWLVSLKMWKEGLPLEPIVQSDREAAEEWLNSSVRSDSGTTENLGQLEQLWRDLRDFRNDLAHCGKNQNPRRFTTLYSDCGNLPEKLTNVAESMGLRHLDPVG